MNTMRHPNEPNAGHPDETRVLLFIDGELSTDEASGVERHLHECQECRAKVQKVQEGIDSFVLYRQVYFLPAVGAPPKSWAGFPALLDRISSDPPHV